ncbi:hypothetical protein SCHPADRAFT_998439 [Schizopora paradoxa]|uniref:Methyltransferase domain-containing protein n=1 Tax=Schizopora paradoxa TaxID=27342 RepID=A0A0H2RJN3_9AGAM|nr:hypothetical protein SCHPADRAFT_998439 [Schizopora paradoxa]
MHHGDAASAEELREVFGRGMNKVNEGYKMPSDDDEMQRLAHQHGVWEILMRGLYPHEAAPLVESLLDADVEGGGKPCILDVGSVHIASQFPDVSVMGVDYIKPKMKQIPENCSFHQLDVLQKDQSKHLEGKFDVVHCRALLGHMTNSAAKHFIEVISGFVKPGGLLIIPDVNGDMYKSRGVSYIPAEDGMEETTAPDHSWMMRWLRAFGMNNSSNGDHRTRADTLGSMLRDTKGIRFLGEESYYIPINYLSEDSVGEEQLSYFMGQDLLHVISATKPALLSAGIPKDEVEKWAELSLKEIRNPKFPLYAKFAVVWGVKEQ